MKELVIIDTVQWNRPMVYNDVILGLTTGHRLKGKNTMLRIDENLISDPEIDEICRLKFDHVVKLKHGQDDEEMKKIIQLNGYTDTKEYQIAEHNVELDYDELMETIDKKYHSHFIFKESKILNEIGRKYENENEKKIREYDYAKSIRSIKNHNKLYERTKDELERMHGIRMRLSQNDSISVIDKDAVILEYMKSRPGIKIMIIWKPRLHELNQIITHMVSENEIYYIKTIGLDEKALMDIVHLLVGDTQSLVDEKIKSIDLTTENNPVCMIIYEEKGKEKSKIIKDMLDNGMNKSKSYDQAIQLGEILLNHHNDNIMVK
jgi:hypothetical protein